MIARNSKLHLILDQIICVPTIRLLAFTLLNNIKTFLIVLGRKTKGFAITPSPILLSPRIHSLTLLWIIVTHFASLPPVFQFISVLCSVCCRALACFKITGNMVQKNYSYVKWLLYRITGLLKISDTSLLLLIYYDCCKMLVSVAKFFLEV